jgi:hypothetical protein
MTILVPEHGSRKISPGRITFPLFLAPGNAERRGLGGLEEISLVGVCSPVRKPEACKSISRWLSQQATHRLMDYNPFGILKTEQPNFVEISFGNLAARTIAKSQYLRRETAAHRVFRAHAHFREVEQITGATRLGPRAAHLESAERLTVNLRPGASAIEVKIADAKFLTRPKQIFRAARVNGAGQREFALIGNFQRMGKIARGKHGQDGSE